MSAPHAAMAWAGTMSPLTLPNLQAWFDASDSSSIHLVSSAVNVWDDKSGFYNGGTISAAASNNRPTYPSAIQNGLPCVLFDGVDDLLRSTSQGRLLSVSGWTLFAVIKPTQNTAIAVPLEVDAVDASSGRAVFRTLATSGYWSAGGRRNNADTFGAADSTTQASTSSFVVLSARASYTNTRLKLYLNDSEIASNTSWLTSGSTPNDNGRIGLGNSGAEAAPFKGYIGEIIVCGSELDLTQYHDPMVNALRQKWAI